MCDIFPASDQRCEMLCRSYCSNGGGIDNFAKLWLSGCATALIDDPEALLVRQYSEYIYRGRRVSGDIAAARLLLSAYQCSEYVYRGRRVFGDILTDPLVLITCQCT